MKDATRARRRRVGDARRLPPNSATLGQEDNRLGTILVKPPGQPTCKLDQEQVSDSFLEVSRACSEVLTPGGKPGSTPHQFLQLKEFLYLTYLFRKEGNLTSAV